MEIALLTSVAGNGGSAATAYHNTKVLRQVGEAATLFAPGTYWPGRGALEGIPVCNSLALRRGFRPLSFFQDFCMLRRFLKEKRVDAVIVQKSPEQWLAFLVLMTIGRKIAFVRFRGVVFPVRPGFFNRWIHNRADLILCSASVIADHFKALPGFRQDHVKVLLEGADLARFAPASRSEQVAAREKMGLRANAVYFGTAGRPAPVKGHDVLVRAFAHALKEAQPPEHEFRLAIFADESRRGPGSYVSLKDLCDELGVGERVDLIPEFFEDMRVVYRALDVYILPSRGSEGSSRAALEARASGLPLIASGVGVLPDLVEDGVNGVLVPPDDVPALARVVTNFMEDWPKAKKLGEAARNLSEDQFNENEYAKRLAGMIKKALGT